MGIARKPRESVKKTEITSNSNGILPEITPKSRESLKIRRIHAEFTRNSANSYGTHTQKARHPQRIRPELLETAREPRGNYAEF